MSGPVNWFGRRMRRGFAITIVYLGLLAVPVLLAALIIPPIVTGVTFAPAAFERMARGEGGRSVVLF